MGNKEIYSNIFAEASSAHFSIAEISAELSFDSLWTSWYDLSGILPADTSSLISSSNPIFSRLPYVAHSEKFRYDFPPLMCPASNHEEGATFEYQGRFTWFE